MPSHLKPGPIKWSMQRDREGHREYKVTYRVFNDFADEGPAHVLECPQLPQPGQWYIIDNDADLWATCKLDAAITQTGSGPGPPGSPETKFWWEVELTFSTKPDGKRCKDEQWDDPLLIPPRISGSFTKYQEEAAYDMFGKPVVNSAWEIFHGPNNEWDHARPSVKISMNVAKLNLPLLTQMQDTVNATPLWGLPARCVKLSNTSWDRKFYGQCFVYYEVNLDFDVRFETFDRMILDEGTKALNGEFGVGSGPQAGQVVWNLLSVAPPGLGFQAPNPANPQHFNRFKDRNNENAKVILNGSGIPSGVLVAPLSVNNFGQIPYIPSGGPGYKFVQKHPPSNFLLLGIPTSF